MVTNIIMIFTGLADPIYVQAGHETGCFNRDLTRDRWDRPFLSKKPFVRLIKKQLWISFLSFEIFWLRHKTLGNQFFLNFGRPDWPLVKTLLEWPASKRVLKQFRPVSPGFFVVSLLHTFVKIFGFVE